MKASMAIIIIVCAFLCSCANSATRYSLDPGEGVYVYSYETTKDQKTAYYRAEEWLSLNITKAAEVVALRQPETGTLIAHPTMQVPVAGVHLWGRYILKINCTDKGLKTTFTVDALDNGAYPPRDAMPVLAEDFMHLSDGLAQYIQDN